MKIGIFDSGLGGLFVMRSIVKRLPQYDYVYFGDTARLPYGNRSHETLFTFTAQALDFLFKKGCKLVIVACNAASSQALREIQTIWLPKRHPNKKVLGVIIPAVEAALEKKPQRIGILGTTSTVKSKTFVKEIHKRNKKISVFQEAAPLLVPLVENDEITKGKHIIAFYIKPLERRRIDTLILGCTHYGILKKQIYNLLQRKIPIISQNDIVPGKLSGYLRNHPEINGQLSEQKKREFYATELTSNLKKQGTKWFGKHIIFKKASL